MNILAQEGCEWRWRGLHNEGTHSTKRPLGKPNRTCEDNITMDLKEMGINTRNWVDSAQDRDYSRALVNAALNLLVSLSM